MFFLSGSDVLWSRFFCFEKQRMMKMDLIEFMGQNGVGCKDGAESFRAKEFKRTWDVIYGFGFLEAGMYRVRSFV